MGTLLLVRHGQASFYADDYDKLSPVGEEQARRLGTWLARTRTRIDRLVAGPRVRQRRTAEILAATASREGLAIPEIEVNDAFDEMQADRVFLAHLPELEGNDPEARAAVEKWRAGDPSGGRAFQRVFARVVERWVRGALAVEGVEPWAAFRARVHAGLDALRTGAPRGARVLAVSSAGPLAVATGMALGAADDKTIELAWQVRNTAVAEFLFSGARFTLHAFNATPHLDGDLVTWR